MRLFTYGPVPREETENVPLKETKIGLVPEVWEVVIPKLPVYLLG
jgi:type I restriction enzyme S subunit